MIYAIHGFCGLASDWDFAREALPDLVAADLWRDFDVCTLPEWAEKTAAAIKSEYGPGPHDLLGYSLGARLAMHLLLAAPKLWKHSTLVSGHPGLAQKSERQARFRNDVSWAKRFRRDPWADLMREWDGQEVFAGHENLLPRRESDFDREILCASMACWSLGSQEDLRTQLRDLPVQWIAGADDAKYVKLLSDFSPHVVAGAGHRVPWDQPQEFLRILKQAVQ